MWQNAARGRRFPAAKLPHISTTQKGLAKGVHFIQKKKQKSIDFCYFFGFFSKYLAPSGAKYCRKGLAAIGKSLGKGLERVWKLFETFCVFCACFAHVLRVFCACFAHVLEKLNFQAVIKSAASASGSLSG